MLPKLDWASTGKNYILKSCVKVYVLWIMFDEWEEGEIYKELTVMKNMIIVTIIIIATKNIYWVEMCKINWKNVLQVHY